MATGDGVAVPAPEGLGRRLLRALGTSLAATATALRNPGLRRLQAGWAASQFGEYVAVVALGVYAYRAGGAAAVGVLGVVQMVPAMLLNPLSALAGDRFRRERVVVGSDVGRAVSLALAAAAVAAGAPLPVVFALAAAFAVCGSSYYPAQTGLVPLLARSAEDVTAAAAASSLIRNAAALAAPAAGGLLLLALPEEALLLVSAAAFCAGAALVAALPRPDLVRSAPRRAGPWREIATGVRAAAADRRILAVLALFSAHSLGRGAVGVFVVVVPLELLGTGPSGVGFVNAVVGLGGFLGALATTGLVGRRRLAGPMGVGLLLTGAPLLLAGALPAAAPVYTGLAAVGVGFAIVSVTGSTLLVRLVRDDLLSRVLGLLGMVRGGAMALGAGVTPVLVHLIGLRWALAVVALVLGAAFVAGRRSLRAIDDASAIPDRELRLLRAAPVFAPILPIALERLATRLEPLRVPAGTELVREGDRGDCVFIVAEGELSVETGSSGGAIDVLRAGELFGEMALLRDASRNATVRTTSDCELYRLGRDEFLAAVTGHPQSAEQAHDLMASRLALRSQILDDR